MFAKKTYRDAPRWAELLLRTVCVPRKEREGGWHVIKPQCSVETRTKKYTCGMEIHEWEPVRYIGITKQGKLQVRSASIWCVEISDKAELRVTFAINTLHETERSVC